MSLLFLLLLPAVAIASIEVGVEGDISDGQCTLLRITHEGFDQRDITANDRTAFEIQDEELKSAIERFHGKKPDQVFLERDTPFGDLFKVHGWSLVQVKIEPGPPHLIDLHSKVVILVKSKRTYDNAHSVSRKKTIRGSITTTDTITSLWTNPRQVSGNDVVITFVRYEKYGVESRGQPYKFGLNSNTTVDKYRSERDEVNLEPKQKVFGQLEAKKDTLRFEIPYKVSLFGHVVARYDSEYKGKSVHGLDINQVLEAIQRNATLSIYETVVYDFYYGEKIKTVEVPKSE